MPKTGELHIQESPDTPGHDGLEENDMLKEKQAKAHIQGPLQLLIITNPALVFRSRTALSCLDVISAQKPMCYFSGGQTKGSLTASREASSASGVSGKERLPNHRPSYRGFALSVLFLYCLPPSLIWAQDKFATSPLPSLSPVLSFYFKLAEFPHARFSIQTSANFHNC